MSPQDLLDQVTTEGTHESVGDETVNNTAFVPSFPEVFDSSILSSFKSCPELFRKTYIEHWKPKALSVHLHAGAAFAKGLEVARKAFFVGEYETGFNLVVESPYNDSGRLVRAGTYVKQYKTEQLEPGNAEDAIACGLQALLFAYGDYHCPPDSAKSAERMAGAFEFYFANYPLTMDDSVPVTLSGGKRGIEFNFAHPLPILHPSTGNPLLYVGRMDAIIHYAGGVYICDEKTTTQLGASWPRQWDLRAQFTGYAWGCQQSGITVEGAIVRGVSILKTKYDTAQSINYRPEWQIDRWYRELLEWIQDIQINWDRTYGAGQPGPWRHNLDHACAEYGGCAFREACMSVDEQPWLETAFERRIWDPLMRTETKV